MKKIIIISLAVIIAIGCFIGYRMWASTPQHSLVQLAAAFKNHDITTVKKYADLDTFSDKFIDSFTGAMDDELKKKQSKEGDIGSALASGLMNLMKPALLAEFKKRLVAYVESGDITSGADQDQAASMVGTIDKAKNNFRGIQYVKTEGKIAVVGVAFYEEDLKKPLTYDIKMRDLGGYWQVTEISNLGKLIKEVAESQGKQK